MKIEPITIRNARHNNTVNFRNLMREALVR
jgi:hypothetical protein